MLDFGVASRGVSPMRRLLQLLVIAAATSGCVRAYPQPAVDEPHADVQIRLVHHQELGPEFDERVRIGEWGVQMSESVPGVRQGTLRVRPEPTVWSFETEFFHSVTTWQTQTYWQSQSYMCGSSRYGPQYCSRSVPVTRTVPVTVRIPDGGCSTTLPHDPIAGAVYLVQYELAGNGVCQASCQRLLAGPGGQLLATPCGPGEPIPTSVVPGGATDAPLAAPPSAYELPESAAPTSTPTTSGGEIVVPAPPPADSGASSLGAPR